MTHDLTTLFADIEVGQTVTWSDLAGVEHSGTVVRASERSLTLALSEKLRADISIIIHRRPRGKNEP